MNPDILKAVGIIDQRIDTLMEIRNKLTEEFGGPSTTAAPRRMEPKVKRGTASNGASHNGDGEMQGTRREQLTKFLLDHGPSSRGTINEKSGIPKGTVANLLNKSGFVRTRGKWYVAPSSAPQETMQ